MKQLEFARRWILEDGKRISVVIFCCRSYYWLYCRGSIVKPWYKSKTMIFNMVVGGLASLEPVLPMLRPLLGESYYPVLMAILTMGNAILRTVTHQGVSFGKT